MSPFVIYSKTGKGVQEASGKTNLLTRGDRVVLGMIDGRASVADLHAQFGKIPESQFFETIEQLEAEGFIRRVSSGSSKESAPAKAGNESSAALDQSTDLDFTSLGVSSVSRPAPQIDLAARARAEAERSRKDEVQANQARLEAEARARAQAEARAKAEAEARARAQAEAKAKAEAEARARVQAEAKAKAEAEARTRALAEAKARAERDAALKSAAEARARAEAEAKARAEAEARAKAAREGAVRAALEAKARAEAELSAKLETERKAREELERKLKEQEERLAGESRATREESEGRVRTEVEELRQRLEEKRRARQDVERGSAGAAVQGEDSGERAKREIDEQRERLAQEQRAHEEADLRAREESDRLAREEADRRAQEEADRLLQEESDRRAREEQDRVRALEDAEAAKAERERKEEEALTLRGTDEEAKHEAEEREWKEQAERLRREQERMQHEAEEEARKKEEERRMKEDEEKRKKFLETQTLFADLNAFSEKEIVAAPELPVPKPVEPVPEKKPAAAPVAPSPRKAAPPPARPASADEELRRELKTLAKSTPREERHARRRTEHRPDRSKEGKDVARAPRAEAKRKAPEIDWKKVAERAERVARKSGDVAVLVGRQAGRLAKRSFGQAKRGYAATRAYLHARAERAEQVARQKAKTREEARATAPAKSVPAPAVASVRRRKPANWGARAVTGLAVLLVAAAGAIHIVPLETAPYEKALSEATGQPVRIGSAHWWLITGPQLRLERVRIAENVRVGVVRAFPDLLSLLSGELAYNRIELEQAVIPGQQLAGTLFGAAKGATLKGVRILAHAATIEGSVKLPALDADIVIGADGKVSTATVRGPDALSAKLSRRGGDLAFEASADKFPVPFVPKFELGLFTMSGTATRQGMTVSAWDGVALGGVLAGTANLRWSDGWSIDGTLNARAMEAGAFAPTLVSDGRTEGHGTYSMRAGDVSGLAASARIQGRFTVAKGTLAKLDLSRAVQTAGQQVVGQTPFLELTGEGSYERGSVLVRNARMFTGGALNAEASLEITPRGSLAGNVVAELTGRVQTLRTAVKISGTLENPQVGQ
jgi:hypothetical protein